MSFRCSTWDQNGHVQFYTMSNDTAKKKKIGTLAWWILAEARGLETDGK